MDNKVMINGKEIPVIQAKTKTIIKHITTGEVYTTEEEWKSKGISPEDIKRDVIVEIPKLDLFAKTK
jgi:hypothetical protein|tara:strand:+ start:1166 stop:1366 length:201 start_codon:yes stop_codon:yes gene_type:complete